MLENKQLKAAHKIFNHLAQHLDAPFSVKIWDGEIIALGKKAKKNQYIEIANPGVLGSIARSPKLETILKLYADKQIDFICDNLVDFGRLIKTSLKKQNIKKLDKLYLLKTASVFLFAKKGKSNIDHKFANNETGFDNKKRNEKDFIQFHYDISNEFYQLFLDPEMLYSCAYFKDWDNSIEQAQLDKLEMICRKLRLKKGDKMLDIGCGWGALACYAAKNFGVNVHGVTLSEEQFKLANEKVKKLKLEKQVTIELKDYRKVQGTFDKISSIGMFEHIGVDNFDEYFGKINSLLRDRGILLNHGIGERHKKDGNRKIRPEKMLILKYIFPGSELTDIGTVTQAMEAAKLEVYDTENWRGHYAKTCELWCKRLTANKDAAIELVGEEKYRMWIAYLAGVHFGFMDGPLKLYQVVASKHKAKGLPELPNTREDLYK